MLDEKNPVLRGMMAQAASLGAKPQFIVEDISGVGKVAYLTVVVAKLADQVYNTLVPVLTQHIVAGVIGELERRGVIPAAPPFVDPPPGEKGS